VIFRFARSGEAFAFVLPESYNAPPSNTNSHDFPDHVSFQYSQISAAAFLAGRSAQTPIPAAVIEVVRELWAGLALAKNLRSLPHSCLRGHAPADSGGSRHPKIPPIPGSLSEFRNIGLGTRERR